MLPKPLPKKVSSPPPPNPVSPTTTVPSGINPLTGKPFGAGTSSSSSTPTIPVIVQEAQNALDKSITTAEQLGLDYKTGKRIDVKPTTTIPGSTPTIPVGINPLTGKPFGGGTTQGTTQGTKKPEPGGWKGLWKDIADVTIDPAGRVTSSALQWIVRQPLPASTPIFGTGINSGGKLTQPTVGSALIMAQAPQRAIISSVKELTDIRSGGFSPKELLEQAKDPAFGFGTAFPSPTGIKWVDRGIGAVGDFALDPLNWAVPFSGVAVEQAVKAGVILATKESAKILVEYSAKGVVRKGLTKIELEAFALADDGYRIATDAVVNARKQGIEASVITGLEQAAKEAEDVVIEIGQNVAKKAQTRGGKVLTIVDERAKAADEWLVAKANNASESVIKDAADKLSKLSQDLTQANIGRYAPRRTYRGYAREDLAERARLFAEKSKQVLDDIDQRLIDDPTSISPAEMQAANVAEQVVKILNPDKIAEIATRGYNALYDDAGTLLGTSSGLRTTGFRVPSKIPLVGGKTVGRKFIPGSDKLTEAIGGGVVEGRLWLINTSTGRRFLDAMTPLGRRGLLGDADSLMMRKALRSGTISGVEAQDYVQLLSANKRYVAAEAALKRTNGTLLSNVIKGINPEQWKELRNMLENGKNVAIDANGDFDFAPAVSPFIREKYADIRNLLKTWYDETNNFHGKYGGKQLNFIEDYFPRLSSDDAIKWAAENEEAAIRVAGFLGVDRAYLMDNFVERVLTRGKKWFGHILSGMENIDELNAMARNAVDGEKSLKFDFFETNSAKALAKYADTHSRSMAYLNTLESMVKEPGGMLQAGTVSVGAGDPSEVYTNLQDLAIVIEERLDIDPTTGVSKMGKWSRFQLESILNDLEVLKTTIDNAPTSFTQQIESAAYSAEIDALRLRIIEIDEGIKQGILDPKAGTLTQDELMSYAEQIGAGLAPTSGGKVDELFDAFNEYIALQPDGFAEIVRLFEDGFSKLGFRNLPDIAARDTVASMLSNIQKLTNRQAASTAERVMGDFNTFFKSWATATPGFNFRNALSNTFQMVAAGANLLNVSEGLKYYNEYWRVNVLKRRVMSPEEFVSTLKDVSPLTRNAIKNAIESVGDSGLIQDYIKSGKIGFSGQVVPDKAPLAIPRQIAGLPLRPNRKLGELVENSQRFALTFDGLMKGNTIEEAVGRTNKYLFDYADLTKVDRVIKQIVPFWIWTSRNLPLQLENYFTNPRLYSNYRTVIKAISADEQDPNMPAYKRKAGVINLTPGIADITSKIPFIGGTDFSPQFGFQGGGPIDQMTQLVGLPSAIIDAALNGNVTSLQEILRSWIGSTTPLAKTGLEFASATSLFRGKPLANEYLPIGKGRQQVNYTLGNIFQPGQSLGNILEMFNAGPKSLSQRQILGMYLPPNDMTEDAATEQAKIESERLIGQYLGSPFTTTTPQQQAAELYRRRAIVEEYNRVEKLKREREQIR